MHTMYFGTEDEHYTIHHNGDWSGKVRVSGVHMVGDGSVELPADLMIACVGEMVRSYRIERVEELDHRTLVTLPPLL